jgi:hypothetical protein
MGLAALIALGWTSVESIFLSRPMADQTAEQHCEQRSDGDCKSLEAEIRNAVAAEGAAVISAQQLWIGLIGLIGLAATVIYARAAWRTAERTLRETSRSAERQLRAYVHISSATYRNDYDGERVELVIHNHGQTPAYDLWVERAASVRDFPLTEALAEPERFSSLFDLAPNAEAGRMTLPFAEWDDPSPCRFGSGGTALYIHGTLHYRDAFGKERRTDFLYYMRSRHDHGLAPADQGNTST